MEIEGIRLRLRRFSTKDEEEEKEKENNNKKKNNKRRRIRKIFLEFLMK